MTLAQWRIKPTIDAPSDGIWLGPGAQTAKAGIRLGSLAEVTSGRTPAVWISTAKEQVIGLFGKRGSGKSFTLGVLLEGLSLKSDDAAVARDNRSRAALLFDPLDIYWTARFPVSKSENPEANRHFQMAQAARVAGLEFEVEAWLPGESSSQSSDPDWFRALSVPVSALGLDEWSILLEADMLSQPIGQALTDARVHVGTQGYTRPDGSRQGPLASYDMNQLADACLSQELVAAYHSETLRALRQRLRSLASTGLFTAVGVRLSAILSPGRLSAILLSRLPMSYRAAIVAVLTRQLLVERKRVAFAEKRLALDPTLSQSQRDELTAIVHSGVPKTMVALDEAQNFLAPGAANPARDTFIQLVKEGRNMGLSATIATQQPSAIDKRILSQIETFVTHQLVTEPDIGAVRENLKSSLPSSIEFGNKELSFADTLRMLTAGQCVVSAADMNTTVRRCLAVAIRARATVHGGIEL